MVYPGCAFSIGHPPLCAILPLVTGVDTRDVCTVCIVRTRQAKKTSSVSDRSSKLIGTSTYWGYLMSAGEQETHASFQRSGKTHLV